MEQIKLEKKTLTITEAAEVIGISRCFAFKLAKEGKLPIIKLGTKRVIPKDALDKWLLDSVQMPKAQ